MSADPTDAPANAPASSPVSAPASDSAATSAPPDFAATPSRPRAGRLLRLLAYLLLLALAIAAIYWIDRGAMLTNTHP